MIFHFLFFSFLFGKNTTTGGSRCKPPVVAANAGGYLKEPLVEAAKADSYLKEPLVVAFSIFFSFLFFSLPGEPCVPRRGFRASPPEPFRVSHVSTGGASG